MITKKRKKLLFLGSLFFLLFVAVSVFTFQKSNQLIENGYLKSEGNAAENFAVLTASNIHLTDQQVKRLKQYTYQEMLDSAENKILTDMMNNGSFAKKVDYAYVMIHLPEEEVKYQVTEENQEIFDAPVGTNLDIMWLMEADIGYDKAEEMEAEAEKNPEYTESGEHYSYYIEDDARIFSEVPSYIFNASEWGDHICGFAPLYSTEGTYIGAVGVELPTGDFDRYRSGAMYAMGMLVVVSTLTLALLFLILYFQYNHLQYERIYTDALTHVYNRSYYNNQFIKKMNAMLPKEDYFALMIADIDWFKKVNDTFGHEIGDQVLLEISTLLVETFGKNHVIRFGGEEFVIGIWVKEEEQIRKQLAALYAEIEGQKFSNQQIPVSISLGCSYCEKRNLNGWLCSNMLKMADQNLYYIKEHGRKQYRIGKYEPGEEE